VREMLIFPPLAIKDPDGLDYFGHGGSWFAPIYGKIHRDNSNGRNHKRNNGSLCCKGEKRSVQGWISGWKREGEENWKIMKPEDKRRK
jgi:hypothetical protein